jgi:outer membrane protein assembly factor BamA
VRALFPFLAATVAFAQSYPLESLHIRGNEAIPEARIIAATGLKLGQKAARPDFVAARERLLETGAFENVGFEFKPSAKNTGYDATFQVVETSPLYRYRFETLPASDADIRAALRKQEPIFGDKIPPSHEVMDRYSLAISKFLGNGAQVTGEVSADTPDELVIVFRPRGDRQNISEVNFTGNTAITQQELWRRINATAIGSPYSEVYFRQMLESSVRGLYEERGRLRVAFPKIETQKSTENEGLVVTVTVDEGEAYKLGKVTFKGIDSKREAELNKIGGWTPEAEGDAARINIAEINAGLARIRKSFHEEGYLRVTTDLQRDVNDTAHTADITVAVDLGPQFRMGKLKIEGLDIIGEPAIRKVWGMKEGAPYKESYPDQFLAMIESEGYFDNLARTSTAADIHDDTHTVDVTLSFLGAKQAAEKDRLKGTNRR